MDLANDFDPILVQKRIRDNSDELQAFLKDLTDWQTNFDQENKMDFDKIESDKNDKELNTTSQVTNKILTTDYSAWEKFDAEAECNKVDKGISPIEKQKQEALYLKEKGNVLFRNGKFQEAIECYTRAINSYSKDPIFFANRAMCNLKLKNPNKVEEDCTKALSIDANYVKALQRRALARIMLKKYTEAEHDFVKALKLDPNNKLLKSELEKLRKDNLEKVPIVKEIKLPKEEKFSWPKTHENIEIVDSINKTPNNHSKKPLKRIKIKSLNDKVQKVLKPKIEQKTLSPVKPSIVKIDDFETPTTYYQFLIDWKLLNTQSSVIRCKYLLKIKPELFPKILGGSFDEYFSEILELFSQNCTDLRFNVLDYLKQFPKIDHFSLCLMFATKKDKSNIETLINYCTQFENNNKEDIEYIQNEFRLK